MAAFSLAMVFLAVYVIISAYTAFDSHAMMAYSRAPLLWYSLAVYNSSIVIVCGIAAIHFIRKNAKWIYWTIGAGFLLLVPFVVLAIREISYGYYWLNSFLYYFLCMVIINIAYIVILIKNKNNNY